MRIEDFVSGLQRCGFEKADEKYGTSDPFVGFWKAPERFAGDISYLTIGRSLELKEGSCGYFVEFEGPRESQIGAFGSIRLEPSDALLLALQMDGPSFIEWLLERL